MLFRSAGVGEGDGRTDGRVCAGATEPAGAASTRARSRSHTRLWRGSAGSSPPPPPPPLPPPGHQSPWSPGPTDPGGEGGRDGDVGEWGGERGREGERGERERERRRDGGKAVHEDSQTLSVIPTVCQFHPLTQVVAINFPFKLKHSFSSHTTMSVRDSGSACGMHRVGKGTQSAPRKGTSQNVLVISNRAQTAGYGRERERERGLCEGRMERRRTVWAKGWLTEQTNEGRHVKGRGG